ncbi:hypothetical protein DIPPA_26501 [Diplonema papillatum]|nr:hypothetical protein DIPPA_26501 [Diplonema papillatum]|eukprot:gene17137-26306_t
MDLSLLLLPRPTAFALRPWAVFMAVFEFQMIYRRCWLNRPLPTITNVLGYSPSPAAEKFFLAVITALSAVRIAFAFDCENTTIALANAVMHASEIPLFGYLYTANVFSKEKKLFSVEALTSSRVAPKLATYFFIWINAALFAGFYTGLLEKNQQ